MYKEAKPLFLICETPLHAGSGSDLGLVDMPIQRERHTDFPKIEGSSLKGAIRSVFEQSEGSDSEKNIAVFGSETNAPNAQAGAIGFTDARLLLFPVKSMKGVFAWVTCPKVVSRFIEDLNLAKIEHGLSDVTELSYIEGSDTIIEKAETKHVILEEYTFEVSSDKNTKNLGEWLSEKVFIDLPKYWKDKIGKDIIVLDDDAFKDFVMLSTEVITRIRVSPKTGTVENGALFTEEFLPAESLLYSLLLVSDEFSSDPVFKEEGSLSGYLNTGLNEKPVFQLGGDASLGKGILRHKLISKENKNESN